MKELVGGGDFNHLAYIHDCYAITDMLDDAEVMGYEEIGQSQLIL